MKYLLLGVLLAIAVSSVAKGEEYGAPVVVDGTLEEEPVATNPLCLNVMTTDGPNGFLWKAQSDNNNTLAILFPESFQRGFSKVSVTRVWNMRNGKKVWRKRPIMDKCTVGEWGNGNRQHARCPLPGSYYDGHVVAEDGDQICEWRVPCPSERQD